MIIGQDKLLKDIDSYNIDSFPRTIMLTGPYGSGKHSIANYIANHFNVDLIDISDKINLDTLESISLSAYPNFYLIDSSVISIKEQNVILKFLEEPLKNAYIILLVENKQNLIETITNRCQEFRLQPYTKETLSKFIENDIDNRFILDICKTPGELKEIKGDKLSDMFKLSEKIINSINKANFANTLTIIDKVSFRNKKDSIVEKDSKFDVFLLTRVTLNQLYEYIKKSNDRWFYEAYDLTVDLERKLEDSKLNLGIDQKYLFAQYITDMWAKSREVINGN